MGRRAGYLQDEVLNRAVMVFRAKGFSLVSVEDLVAATGLNRFALYEKFEGKEGLFYAAMEYYHRVSIKAQLLGSLYARSASLEAILVVLRTFQGLNLDLQLPRGCLIINANIELGGSDERIAAEADYVMATFREAIAHALKRASNKGEVTTARSIADQEDYLIVMLQAFFSLAYLSREAAGQLIERVIAEVESWRVPPLPADSATVSRRPRPAVFQNVRAGSQS